MGAVKALAIEIEANAQEAQAIGHADLAYRLGLLEACRLLNELRAGYIGRYQPEEASFDVLTRAWNEVFEAAEYLAWIEAERKK